MRAKHEENLEKMLKKYSGYFGCMYVKIPDTKMINSANRSKNREEKRPFDGIFIAEDGQNICIECKANRGSLRDHQKDNETKINLLNNSFYVVRVVKKDENYFYTIEKKGKIIHKIDKIEELILKLKEISVNFISR